MNDPGLDDPIENGFNRATRNLRRQISRHSSSRSGSSQERKPTRTTAGAFRQELKDDEQEEDLGHSHSTVWWFTSTAFPLIAGTFGPLANLFSICALAQTWRIRIDDGSTELHGSRVPDPPWLLALNAVSLAAACAANLLLLFNFAHRVRYWVAQPMTITFWYLAAVLLIIPLGLTRDLVLQPTNNHAFSQSYYYAVIAAALYTIISTLLVWNVLGAWKFKAYPASFNPLTLPQRTLMLQTISYVMYLALGAGIFSAIEGWNYLDGLYWSNYTLLTIGLGSDFSPSTTLGRALLIPYAAVGITMIGLIVGSIRGLVLERGKAKVGRRTLGKQRDKKMDDMDKPSAEWNRYEFEAMRKIEERSERVQRYSGLGVSLFAYAIVWLGGALVFWFTEKRPQHLTYFQALYFAYVSLLTVGYGDLYPQSNSGKPFFVVWSLMAVPTVTILISNLGSTVIEWLKEATIWIGQRTILPEQDHDDVGKGSKKVPGTENQRKKSDPSWNPDDEKKDKVLEKDVEQLGHAVEHAEAQEGRPQSLIAKISREISNIAKDLKSKPPRKYDWDEWQKFLRLIGPRELRVITSPGGRGGGEDGERKEEEADWSWLGEGGPLFSTMTEAEWVLDKLCKRLESEIEERDSKAT